jgi:hypothetical protein
MAKLFSNETWHYYEAADVQGVERTRITWLLIGWQQPIGESRVLNSEMTLASTVNVDVIRTLAVWER